jgi:predicted flap endonuclease-1-like 5' DNA nuclease
MSLAVVSLVSFAVAFMAGGLLSKAYFAMQSPQGDSVERQDHHKLLKAQRSRYRKRVTALHNVIRRHEEARELVRNKISVFEQSLETGTRPVAESQTLQHRIIELESALEERQQQIASLQKESAGICERTEKSDNELALLGIERQELSARIQRLESELHDQQTLKLSDDSEPDATEVAAALRADMGELRETVATKEHRIQGLEIQLRDSEVQLETLQTRLTTWKQRVKPLTQKLKHQRSLIRKLRNLTVITEPAELSEENSDNLQRIRGIGPALERRLYGEGIRRYAQIAAMSDQELNDVATKLSIAPALAHRDNWVTQARDLAVNSPQQRTA